MMRAHEQFKNVFKDTNKAITILDKTYPSEL
jgi:hypothetical protein